MCQIDSTVIAHAATIAQQYNTIRQSLGIKEADEIDNKFKNLGIDSPKDFISNQPTTVEEVKEKIIEELDVLTVLKIRYYSLATSQIEKGDRNRFKWFIASAAITFLAAILSGLGVYWMTQGSQKFLPQQYIVLPKAYIVHDTIYLPQKSK